MPDSTAAAMSLQQYARVRARAADRGPTRGYSWLLVWSGLLLSVYFGVFLSAYAGFEAGSAESGGYTYTNLLLLPVLLFSALVSGARDRFSIRSRSTRRQVIGYIAAILAFMVLGALTITGMTYPWWLNLLAPVALFTAMSAAPLRELLTTRSTRTDERWGNLPLANPARWTTAMIGVAFGVLAATTTLGWFPIISAATLLVTLSATLISWRLPWGLRATGHQWGPAHWGMFAATTAFMFALAVALSVSVAVTTPVAVSAGAMVCVFMVGAAFLPFRSQKG